MRALIVESGYARGALAASRGLAAGGWTVGIASPERGGLAASSRRTRRWHPISPPEQDVEGFLAGTSGAIAEGGYEVVFGCGDAEVLALSRGRESLEASVPYPAYETLLRALDKLELAAAATEADLRVPSTTEATEVALARIERPVVVKPRLHWVPGATCARQEASVARGPEEAARRAADIRSAGGQPILQELVSGRLVAYTAIVDHDLGVVADVQQEAAHIWPPEAGVSVRAVTVPISESLSARVEALLGGLGWWGLAQLQFVAPDGEEPYLLDLNGRFYGSLALALASGLNLPLVWANLATGRPVPRSGPATAGVRYQWLEGDLRRSLAERRGGLARDVWGCLAYARGATHSIWRKDDPWPAVRYAGHLFGRAARKLLP